MTDEHLDARVLGQLLLMQSIVINLPNHQTIFSFVCKGLKDIPGVENVIYSESPESPTAFHIYFPINVGASFYGELCLCISDVVKFRPYENYLKNFTFMLAVILEERKQRELNDKHQLQLEQRIQERTFELNLEKENLAESQRRFTDLMTNVKLLSVMLDTDGNIIFCNNFLQELTGYTADEITGKNWFDLFFPENVAQKAKAKYAAVMSGAELANNYEKQIITKAGEVKIIFWNNTSLYDSNRKRIGTASIGEDITQRKLDERALKEKNEEIEAQNEEYVQLNDELLKAKDKAEESDRLKTAFLQNMSHEIRTPMNAIMGFSDLLVMDSSDKDKLEKFAGIINQRCNDLLEIINDILDIAKIESGLVNINLEEFNLKELFDELSVFFTEYQKRIKKEHLHFVVNGGQCLNNLLISDKVKLKQIFINLINNAFKFTNAGKIEVGCRIKNNSKIEFYVSDTGIGIPPDKHKLVFERFYQLKENSRMNLGGTGLGLSIVKGLLELLDGEIKLESEHGQGSTFTFTIPYNEVFTTQAATSKLEITEYANLTGRSILVVEDDFFNLEYITEILSSTGVKILEAASGKAAIEKALSNPIDVVLMDIRLPDINGYEAISEIKKHKPDLIIIAQTAYASQDERKKAEKAGCCSYISKPIKKEKLLAMVNNCLVNK